MSAYPPKFPFASGKISQMFWLALLRLHTVHDDKLRQALHVLANLGVRRVKSNNCIFANFVPLF